MGTLLFRLRNEPGPPLFKHTRVSRMMKSGSATLMDRSFQLVLNCLDTEQAPFSTETLMRFLEIIYREGPQA